MRIGDLTLPNTLIAAPMAGVTDRPFRALCRRLGAGLAVSEMVSSDPSLRGSRKSMNRLDHRGEQAPVSAQIAGADPHWMADAARFNVDHGAQIVDINMGCPAKKVCNRAAGSALLSDEPLVGRILDAVVGAVDVPVTLKIRTGPEPHNRNAVRVAQLAQSAGIAALSIHGRTRACAFRGEAEHHSTREVKRSVGIPVFANGDITSPERAQEVLRYTGADGLLIGRAAQGNPWIFREIAHYLAHGTHCARPSAAEVRAVMLEHLAALYAFYGERQGVRIARKHLSWYCKGRKGAARFWQRVNRVEDHQVQQSLVSDYADELVADEQRDRPSAHPSLGADQGLAA